MRQEKKTCWGDGWLDAAGGDFGLGGMSDIFLFLFLFLSILGGMLRLKPDPSHKKIYELLEERTLVGKNKKQCFTQIKDLIFGIFVIKNIIKDLKLVNSNNKDYFQ